MIHALRRKSAALLLTGIMIAGHGVGWADQPSGWVGGQNKDYQFDNDTEVKHGGKVSAVIRAVAEIPFNNGTFSQLLRADNFRGKRVRLSAFMKTEAVEGWGDIWMRIDTVELTGVKYGLTRDKQINGTKNWAEYEVVLDVPSEADAILFGGSLNGKGRVWFDDMSLSVVADDVPATRSMSPRRPRTQPTKTEAPKEIVNPDFEQ